MKHNFSDQELTLAWVEPALDAGESYPTADVDYIRAFLDALPEPASDEWQECSFEDIRKGDRVKVIDTHEAGDQTVYEGDIVQVSKGLVMTAHHNLHSVYNSKWYRIPKPVTPPDPAQHPVIMVHLHNGVKETKRAFVWNGESYGCLDGPHSFLAPYQITKWSPAKVVVEDDR